MSNLFNKTFAIKAAPKVIRTEQLPGRRKAPILPSKVSKSGTSTRRPSDSTTHKSQTTAIVSPSAVDRHGRSLPCKKRKTMRQRTPVEFRPLSSDSSDSDNFSDLGKQSFRRQKPNRPVDKKRKLDEGDQILDVAALEIDLIHAAHLISLDKRSKSKTGDLLEATVVKLQYPSVFPPESYVLVCGEDFNPFEEIISVVQTTLDFYLTEDQAKELRNPETGIIRKLTKAKNLLSKDWTDRDLLNNFKTTVESFNSKLNELIASGIIKKFLKVVHDIPLYMVECILQQVYSRAVSPKVDILKRYENGTDNVYGELLPPLVSKILAEAGLSSENLFVDLGSGVGNVVLQAALEFGCESWGCEMMENACLLADAQKKEFSARCHLWGLSAGSINLQRGDFLNNTEIHSAMQKADVILVNNQAFTPDLNQKLKDLFLDLKNGCKIISLKSFVPHGHQISSRNLWDPANLLDVVEGEYHSRSVSWTNAGGRYYIATKDDKRLNAFGLQ